MSILARVDEVVRPEAPAERLAALRILVGAFAVVYVVARAAALAGVAHHKASDFKPVGPVKLLSAPAPEWVVYGVVGASVVLSVPFLLGWRYRWTAPAFAAALTWATSYRNSFGMIFHTENLLVFHVIVLAFTAAASAWSLDARGRTPPPPSRSFGVGIQILSLVTAFSYVLAGVAKWRVSGTDWITGDVLRNHIAHDNLRKALLGDGHSAIGAWLVAHPWIFKPLAVVTMIFELGAPLALLSRRAAAVVCGGLWAFHVGVLAIMWIFFPYPLFGLAFASFFRAEAIVARGRILLRGLPWRAS